MGFRVQVKSLTIAEIRWLVVQFFFGIGDMVAVTFANLFLWQKNESITLLILYNLAIFIAIPLGSILAGFVTSRMSIKTSYAAGLTLYIFMLGILCLSPDASVFLIGSLTGLAIGMQSFGHSLITQFVTKQTNREFFFGIKSMVYNSIAFLSRQFLQLSLRFFPSKYYF